MKKIILILSILFSVSSYAQQHVYLVADSGLWVNVTDSNVNLHRSYPKNTLTVYYDAAAQKLTLYQSESRFSIADWVPSTVHALGVTTLVKGKQKLVTIIYTSIASSNTNVIIDSGGTLIQLPDSNTILPLKQDTVGAGESTTYNPYSFGLAFENAIGSVDITINGVTFTYESSIGNLPYNPSHRQTLVVDASALTSGRIRILYK